MIEDCFDPTVEMPLAILGLGGDYQVKIGEGGGTTIQRVTIEGEAERRGFFGLGPKTWVGLLEIPSRGVLVKNLQPGTKVEWIDIPAAVAETSRKSTAYFEGLCMGIGLGMVALALLFAIVS